MVQNRRKIRDYIGMGTLIGFCAAIGLVLGIIVGKMAEFIFWLAGGAAMGVVIGAAIETRRRRKREE